jgi:hypothetical protein
MSHLAQRHDKTLDAQCPANMSLNAPSTVSSNPPNATDPSADAGASFPTLVNQSTVAAPSALVNQNAPSATSNVPKLCAQPDS